VCVCVCVCIVCVHCVCVHCVCVHCVCVCLSVCALCVCACLCVQCVCVQGVCVQCVCVCVHAVRGVGRWRCREVVAGKEREKELKGEAESEGRGRERRGDFLLFEARSLLCCPGCSETSRFRWSSCFSLLTLSNYRPVPPYPGVTQFFWLIYFMYVSALLHAFVCTTCMPAVRRGDRNHWSRSYREWCTTMLVLGTCPLGSTKHLLTA